MEEGGEANQSHPKGKGRGWGWGEAGYVSPSRNRSPPPVKGPLAGEARIIGAGSDKCRFSVSLRVTGTRAGSNAGRAGPRPRPARGRGGDPAPSRYVGQLR